MSDNEIEQLIQDKGKTAARVTPEHIQSLINGEYYFSAENGVNGNIHKQDELTRLTGYHSELKLLTFCVLVLKNGFTVTGESACANSENFDEEIGRKIARQNAVNKIWILEGYLLKEKLSEQ
ncbi:Gp49 family protein [Citrobacter sp. OP27]